jgi:hypothetical protein
VQRILQEFYSKIIVHFHKSMSYQQLNTRLFKKKQYKVSLKHLKPLHMFRLSRKPSSGGVTQMHLFKKHVRAFVQ